MIIPRRKSRLSGLPDPPFRANVSRFPQNGSGTGTEVAVQPLDYRIPELDSLVKDAVRHDRRSRVLDKGILLWYADGWI